MSLVSFLELERRADQLDRPVRVAAIGGDDATVLEALSIAAARGWVDPIVLGSEQAIRSLARQASISLEGMSIIDSAAAARDAVDLVRGGRAEVLMKGRIATPDLMRAVLDRDRGLRTAETVCQIVLMEIPRDDRRFLMADTGITIAPTLDQAKSILHSAAVVAKNLGVTHPTVAVMAATEKQVDSMPETFLAEQLQGETNMVVSGPLSFDLAYSAQSAERKGATGQAAGIAEIMLFPNLLSANLCVKAIMYTADCRFGGMLGGVACPVVFMSRSDDVPTRLRSLALVCAAGARPPG